MECEDCERTHVIFLSGTAWTLILPCGRIHALPSALLAYAIELTQKYYLLQNAMRDQDMRLRRVSEAMDDEKAQLAAQRGQLVKRQAEVCFAASSAVYKGT